MAVLYIVATPIGNLKDITLRALEILGSVDLIACENTRHTLKLLNSHSIRKPLISCNAFKERRGQIEIIKHLKMGKDIAYVTDAGTPALSDPGAITVKEVREAGFSVLPIPGASAFSTLLSVHGQTGKGVLFDGFLSPKGGKRRKRLEILMQREESFFLFESPYRILKLLSDIITIDPEREVFLGREMTKIHEEYQKGTAKDVYEYFSKKDKIKGEFSIIVSGKKKT